MIIAVFLDSEATLVRQLLEAEISRLEELDRNHPGESFAGELSTAQYALKNLHSSPPRTVEQQASGTNDPYRRRSVRS